MKEIALTTCAILLAVAFSNQAFAGREDDAKARNLIIAQRHRALDNHRPAAPRNRQITGVLARAVRGGNPLQLLNPFAPAEYGTAEENVVAHPGVPGKADGIDLFRISF